jgi:L-ascorbate metabolism protein UlaG (beta-lactamase superfamily)
MDRALAAIEQVPAPAQGAMIWKMYSSGFIVKARGICFSVDVVEGPVQDELATAQQMNARTEPMMAGGGRRVHQVKLDWTPGQRRKFARLVDAHFITHRHYDHASFTLVRELLAAGKTVVTASDLKQMYVNAEMPGAASIVVPHYSRPDTIAGMHVLVFLGFQNRYNTEEVDGERRWVWNERPPMNNVYVFRAGGLNIMHNGDCRRYDQEFYPWLVGLMHTEWQPDVCLLIEYFRDARRAVQNLYDPFIIPCHELELGHVRVDDAGDMHLHVSGYTSRLRGYAGRIREGKAAVMGWGEALLLRPTEPSGEQ